MTAMLKSAMMRDAAQLIVPAGVTIWQAPTSGETINLTHVHVQRAAGITASATDINVQTQATLFYDRQSRPHGIDWVAVKASAEAVGASIEVAYKGHTYSVQRVTEYRDGTGGIHHTEIEVV